MKNRPNIEAEPMMRFIYEAWMVVQELAPWLLLGALVAGLLHWLLPAGFIARRLSGKGGVATAVVLGVPLPLCSCGVIPAGLGLKEDGASDGATVGFMISTPQTGVDSVLVSAAFLGLPFAVFKVLSAAVMGLVGGWIAEVFHSEVAAETNATGAHKPRPTWREGAEHGITMLRPIWGWLVFGVLASAAITIWLPAEALTSVAGWGALGAGLAALVV